MAAYQPNTFEDPDWQPVFEQLDQAEDDEIEVDLNPAQAREYQQHMLKLAVTLEFGPDDLEANRNGYLSPAQIERFEGKMRRDYWLILSALSVLAFVLGLIGINVLPGGWFLLVLTGAVMLFALGMASTLSGELRSLPDRAVGATSIKIGRFSLWLHRLIDDEGDVQFVAEGEAQASAPKSLYKVLRPNQNYRAYYMRLHRKWGSNRIISMEPVGKWSADAPEEKSKRKRGKFKRGR